jgi:succinoglycan biosynthesis protein ExoM
MTPRISIIIPTQRRPMGLERAIRSVASQAGVDFADIELVVVDNDLKPSARALAEHLVAGSPIRLIYAHERTPGVASARNRAVRASRGKFIAFLDDDEEAPPNWLSALLSAQQKFDADVVFGAVKGRAPTEIKRHREYLERFFSRPGPDAPGLIDGYYGCGNSLVRRSALPSPRAPFCVSRNRGGGEDDLLFSAMQASGAKFAWAPEAWVWEDPEPSRLSLRYTMRRAFGFGQAPPATCAAMNPPNWAGVAGWMAQGVGQSLVFSLLAAGAYAIGSARFAPLAERAVRGLGKTFWWDRFKISYYGLLPGQKSKFA